MTFERKPVLVVVAILAGLAACESRPAGAGTGPPPAPLLQVSGNDIVSSWANVSLWRDGVAVADATVVVNGTLIPPVALEAGRYSGALPAVLPAGEPVVLEVTSGDSRVTGVGKIPYTPVLTAAYTAAAIASDGDIAVTWTSPSDPDYFTVSAEWSCGPSCGAGTGFETAGSARSLTIEAGSLPPGLDVLVAVLAYNDGSFDGDYASYPAYPGMNIRAQSDTVAVSTGLTAPPPPALQVWGGDIGAGSANVFARRDGVGIDDALVTVNGQVLPSVAGELGAYWASLASPLAPGDAVALEVSSGGLAVTGLGFLPDAPALTSPSSGASFTPGEDVAVTWTSPSDPDYFTVTAEWSCGPSCGAGTGFETAGSARALTIPAASLPSGVEISLIVFAYVDGTFSGDYRPYVPYPGMNIRNESNPVTIRR